MAELMLPNFLGAYNQGVEARRQNALIQRQEMERQRAEQEASALRNYLQGADLSTPEAQNQLLRFGAPGAEIAQRMATIGKERKLERKADLDVLKAENDQKIANLNDMLNIVTSAKNPAAYANAIKVAQAKGYDTSQIPQTFDPDFVQIAHDSLLSAKDQAELEAKKLDRGLREREIRAREGEIRDRTDRSVVAHQQVSADGTVTNFNRYGEVISAKSGAGKPSATFEKTKAKEKQMGQDIGFALSQLKEITKDGGLIDQSTGSGAGRLADVAAGFIGNATSGAIAIGKLKPIADLVLKLVPRFEGPQSDADTQSYKEAAGQLADPTLPREIRKEAGKTIINLMTKRQGQFGYSDQEGAIAAGDQVDTNNPLLK